MDMESTERKSKSKIFCCVFNCNSLARRSSTLFLHTFPAKGSLVVPVTNKFGREEMVNVPNAWERALKMGKLASNYMRVRSLHFTPNDYFQRTSRKKFLKEGHAVELLPN